MAALLAATLLTDPARANQAVTATAPPDASSIVAHYADLALATYTDARDSARALDAAVDGLLDSPDEAHLDAARDAWIAARVPYQQSEVFRFGNPIVDDWEGRVNAWPLDEGLIDYVDAGYGTDNDDNGLYTANVIAHTELRIDGQAVDLSAITPALIANTLHEAGGIEANVASGYHAIEFLLWGQDLNWTGAGAGNRPATDFSLPACTHDHCDRRRTYLDAATDLLLADLDEMVANWQIGGAARTALLEQTPGGGIAAMLTGMGSLSYGELAGERMKLGLLLGDPEEEQDCFSDNTHASHLNDVVGMHTVYTGRYRRIDGSLLEGPSLAALLQSRAPDIATELGTDLDDTLTAMQTLTRRAETTEAYDQMIATGNAAGNATVQAAIDALITQTRTIERAMQALDIQGVTLAGSDSLDGPSTGSNGAGGSTDGGAGADAVFK